MTANQWVHDISSDVRPSVSTPNLRIVLSTNSRDRGSTSRTLEAWSRLLPASGVQPTVTVGGMGPLFSALQEANIPARIRPLRVRPYRTWPFPFAYAVLRLAATIKAARASVVHVNEHDHHVVAAHAAALTGVRIVTHLRFKPEPDYCRWLFRPGRTPDRLFFTSRSQMQDSADAVAPVVPRERWRLLPNGLDFAVFGGFQRQRESVRADWRLDSGTIAVGTACAISPRKRLDHFIRLIARLRATGVPAHGFIAGGPHFPEDQKIVVELRHLAASLAVTNHVTFLGYVEPIEPLFHAWDLCVSTSSYETFGMTVLEAMGCGCPVLAYPGGSVQEIVGEAAKVVADGDERALLDAAIAFSRDAELRREMGARGRRHAQCTYDIHRIVETLAAEYREVVSERALGYSAAL